MISNISFAFLFRDIVVSNHARAGKEIRPGHKGSILISLLVTMTILSALGAAMLPLFSSSTMSSTSSNDARKALYMAESGLRYALSELRNSGFSTNAVNELNSTTYSLDDGGTFTINVFGIEFESPSNQTLPLGGTLSLVAPVGKMPEGFSIPATSWVVNLKSLRDALIFGGTPDTFTAQVQISNRVSDTELNVTINHEFNVDVNDLVCLAVRPSSTQNALDSGSTLNIALVAKDFFPKRNGAIYISNTDNKVMLYFYDERIDIPGDRVQLTGLSSSTAGAFPFSVNDTTNYVILSGKSYRIIPTGSWGTDVAVSYLISSETTNSASDESHLPAPGESSPDFSPQEVVDSLSAPVVSDARVVVVEGGEIKLGGNVLHEFGAVWFGGTNNIGGIADFCTDGKCQFNYGIRTFFKLYYNGTGDGFTLAFINGANNGISSVGGDAGAGELLAYAGDSRTGSFGPIGYGFLDGTGSGLQSPKMALEFDTYTNAGDGPLCETVFKSDRRNDPKPGDINGKDVLQYVFWGSKEGIACRTSGGIPSPTYDDNRHGAGGELEEWAYTTGGDVNSSPAVGSDGTIYVGSNDYKLYAIGSDGVLKWSYTTADEVGSSPAIGSDGTIYVGSKDGNLYAITDGGDHGILKWSYPTGGEVRSSPAIGSDGTIYVGSYNGNLYAITDGGGLGILKWSYLTGGEVRSSPAVGSDGTIYVGSKDGKLYAITDGGGLGILKWSYLTGGEVRSSPAIGSDGTIYVGSHYDKLYAITDGGGLGILKWSYLTGHDVNSSPTIDSDGTIYVGSNDDNLYAITDDGGLGVLKWSYLTGGDINSSPAIGPDGAIHVGSNDGKVYVLRSDGTLRSAFDTLDSVESSPAIAADGTVYVGSKDNNLYAIDSTDNPQNIKDKYYTYDEYDEDLIADGVAVDNTTNWLNGAFSKGPWAVRMEVTRSTVADEVSGKYEYTLKTWIRQCDDLNCDNIDGTYFADTSIEYGAQPPHLEQTIELSAEDHGKFDTFLFGLTEATGGAVQTATISNLQLSFIRPGDAVINSDPSWP